MLFLLLLFLYELEKSDGQIELYDGPTLTHGPHFRQPCVASYCTINRVVSIIVVILQFIFHYLYILCLPSLIIYCLLSSYLIKISLQCDISFQADSDSLVCQNVTLACFLFLFPIRALDGALISTPSLSNLHKCLLVDKHVLLQSFHYKETVQPHHQI